MSEPILHVDHDHAHAHTPSTGNKRTDRLLAYSAILISILSLINSCHHGALIEQANSTGVKPLLTINGSNWKNNTATTWMAVRNSGTGPAIVHQFELYYKNENYKDFISILQKCCITDDFDSMTRLFQDGSSKLIHYEITPETVIVPREEVSLFEWEKENETRHIWRRLEKERVSRSIGARACYCSFNGECWSTDFTTSTHTKVESCKRASPQETNYSQ